MLDQLFIEYVVSSLVILFISCRDWGNNRLLDRGSEIVGAGGRGRKVEWGNGEGV
jgi:hypothetical protein